MFKKFINWFDGGYDREFYKKHQEDIQKSNSRVLGIGLITISIFLSAFLIVELTTGAIHIHVNAFAIMLGLTIILFAIHTLITKNNYIGTLIIMSIFVASFSTFLIFEETYYMHDKNAVIFYVFMLALPIVIIAPPYAILNYNILSFVALAIMSYIYKDHTLFFKDIMFGLCCIIAGIFLGRHALITTFDAYALRDKLEYQSRYDPLTNIYNRRAGRKRLENVMASEDKIAVAMIDIDDFKLYNDTYGHVKGDEVLRTLSSIFLYHARKQGFFVSRFGGEEFLFVTYGPNMEIIKNILDECAKDMKLAHIEDKNSKYGTVTFSAGYTMTRSCKNIEQLVETADEALYIAKENGKNKIVFKGIDKE